MKLSRPLLLAILLTAGVYAVAVGWHVRHGALNPDEGFYAVATRAVSEGEVPYRDFGFTQPPLVLYANALPLRVLGFGLFPQRLLNGLWAGAALLLAAVWLGRATRPGWGLTLILFAALSSPWMYFMHLGKTYAFTALLVMSATWVFLEMKQTGRRTFLLGLLAVAGVGTRLPAAPFFGLLWLWAVVPGRAPTKQEAGAALGGVLTGLVLLALPLSQAGLATARFWILEFHQISVPRKDWHLQWQEIATLAPAAWTLAALAVIVALRQWRKPDRSNGVFVAASVTLAANLLPGGVYEEYAVPFLLPLVITAGAWVHSAMPPQRVWAGGALVVLLGMIQLCVTPLLYYQTQPQRRWTVNAWLPFNAPEYNSRLPEQLRTAREVIERNLPAGSPFVGSNLILAAETGRAVPAELRMGPFAFTREMSADRAAHLHLSTAGQLDAWLADSRVTTLAYFPNSRLNYSWSMPSFDLVPDAERTERFARTLQAFDVQLAEGDFLLLVRKPIK